MKINLIQRDEEELIKNEFKIKLTVPALAEVVPGGAGQGFIPALDAAAAPILIPPPVASCPKKIGKKG